MLIRPRRNRKSAAVRAMLAETSLSPNDLMFPLFLLEGKDKKEGIVSMPGISRLSLDLLLAEIGECAALGLQAFAVFPCVPDSQKDKTASESWREGNFYLSAVSEIKKQFPAVVIMTDVAMDPYSSDGHDGVYENGRILNDETLDILAKMAGAQAAAGADFVGPSDMMDGRVGFIRQALDKAGDHDTSIMAYTAKYASAFYGPFRDALDSAPKHGDKKTYQMDPANAREALREAALDQAEGADMLMVKPALPYLDIIKSLSESSQLPIAAYNVSGEYAMIKAAAQNGWIDGEQAMIESLTAIKRAGAKVILSYFAKEFAAAAKQ